MLIMQDVAFNGIKSKRKERKLKVKQGWEKGHRLPAVPLRCRTLCTWSRV